ncbi:MAG: 2-oxoglutarate dehydrogenase complex dihydrolipoyllysine-residue succinyltransferase [Trueperaceae bacterium]|nr:2-oxoglutarate dehydrogenase complex dihydrolipoyllysine-residue succinyltransferase [Trueperaceae bacterium]
MADVKVPSVGESISEVFIGSWLKKPGERVERDEALVEVETDKASLEVPAPESGVLAEILKKEGDEAEVGEVIARITAGEGAAASGADEATDEATAEETADDEAPEAEQAQPSGSAAQEGEAPSAPATSGDGEADGGVMPAAQRMLDEHDVDAGDVRTSGPGGRLLKEDVQRHLDEADAEAEPVQAEQAQASPQAPPPTSAGTRHEETVKMSPLRRTIARRLVEAQRSAALLTTFNEVDMQQVMALRNAHKEAFEKRYGVRLGFMSFFVKASIDALKTIPRLNAEIRDQSVVFKDYYDIAVAVSTERGLVTPVIRNAEALSFAEIETTIGDFGRRAQDASLTPEELQGGTFTISNGGVFGSLLSTPIVNPPQSGVLGMHTIQERPVAIQGRVEIRPMMYLALTYDHRIVDGREAVTFLKRIKDAIEQPARMLVEI